MGDNTRGEPVIFRPSVFLYVGVWISIGLLYVYSRTPLIQTLVIRIADYPNLLDLANKYVESLQK